MLTIQIIVDIVVRRISFENNIKDDISSVYPAATQQERKGRFFSLKVPRTKEFNRRKTNLRSVLKILKPKKISGSLCQSAVPTKGRLQRLLKELPETLESSETLSIDEKMTYYEKLLCRLQYTNQSISSAVDRLEAINQKCLELIEQLPDDKQKKKNRHMNRYIPKLYLMNKASLM